MRLQYYVGSTQDYLPSYDVYKYGNRLNYLVQDVPSYVGTSKGIQLDNVL